MSKRLATLLALLAAALLLTPANAETVAETIEGAPEGDALRWRWIGRTGRVGALDIAIVRGQITIEQAPDDVVTLDARSTGPIADARAITIGLERSGDGLTIRDRFPPRPPLAMDFSECLPIDPTRGDWRWNRARLDIVLRAPRDAVVFAHSMDGTVIDRRTAR